MAKVIITEHLEELINRKFKQESITILSLLCTLEEQPKKGKEVGHVGNIVVKEIKYDKFRFYFVSDRHAIKFLSAQELKDILIKFVAMSGKKDQQKVIDEIKHILRMVEDEGFK
jgi:Icc-related predicted phosphoesterase